MKNKATKVLIALSVIITGIGIVCWFGTNLLINETNNIALLFSLFGATALRLLIVGITIGIITIMWLIYGIVILCKRIKSGNIKWKNLIFIGALIVLITIVAIIIAQLLNTNNGSFTKSKFDYNIKYQNGISIYNIYKTGKKIDVYADEQVICITDPCPTIKTIRKINFSDDNMVTVNNFIDSFFEYHEYNSIQIFKENLTVVQSNILDSIIYNDERLLKNKMDISSDYYTIITDSKYRTMQNDGGSNFNVYYEIDLNSNVVKKFEDHYIGFKGYEYKQKLIYKKNIDNDISSEMDTLLFSLLSNEDVNDTNNYSPYIIKFDSEDKSIYNENSIKSLKFLLNKIDNLDNIK